MNGAGAGAIRAVSEAEAYGETAALFADIRHGLGVPVVNLVWRHLATIPGGLGWAWGTVRPLYASGRAAREGASLLGALPLPTLSPWSAQALRAAGVDGLGRRAVVAVLESYNRSNAMNLIALCALARGRGDGLQSPQVPLATAAAPGDEAPAIEGRLPELLSHAQMSPTTAALVQRLDRIGERSDGIPASLYRHLAHWPGFLALADARLTPLDRDGCLQGLIDAAHDVGRSAGERMAGALARATPDPGPETQEAVRQALARFTGGVIAKMVPICALLRRAMPAP